jgi:hypothetical protein
MNNETTIVNPYLTTLQTNIAQHMSENQERIQNMRKPAIIIGHDFNTNEFDAVIFDRPNAEQSNHQRTVAYSVLAASFVIPAAIFVIHKIKEKKKKQAIARLAIPEEPAA